MFVWDIKVWDLILEQKYTFFFFFQNEQSKSYFFKQKVIHGNEPMHGRISSVYHFETEEKNHLFENIPSPFSVVRYHSLIISKGKILIKFNYISKKTNEFLLIDEFPSELKIIAETEDQAIMAIKHSTLPFWGVQFHPEVIIFSFFLKTINKIV